MGTVVELPGVTLHPVQPDKVLTGHVGKLDAVMVLGIDKNGEFVAAMSTADLKDGMWLATKFLHKCHDGSY